MLDGRVDALKPGEEVQAFNHKSVWARMAIVAAGPMANFVFALFAFWLMFMIGVPSVKPVVGEVRPASIVAEAGILPGMEIVGVGGEETGDWESVTYALISHLGDDSVQLKLRRPTPAMRWTRPLQLAGWKFDPDKESPIGSLGIVPLGGKVLPVVEAVVPSSASEKAGLQIGIASRGRWRGHHRMGPVCRACPAVTGAAAAGDGGARGNEMTRDPDPGWEESEGPAGRFCGLVAATGSITG